MSEGARGDARPARGARGWFWLQLLIGWLPVWALYATMILVVHGGPASRALLIASRAIGAAALLGLPVLWLTERLPWPRPVRVTFVLGHLVAALAYAVSWVMLTGLIESLAAGQVVIAPSGVVPFLFLGIWLYFAVAGVSYAVRATERAALADAAAARSQLAALRNQLNPHFLFNALHTVVHLIPDEPARAAAAAEQLASLLRVTIEEDRDLVPLAEERAFVERYLAIERIRFGDRLEVAFDIDATVEEVLVPSFALQTLVENAVRHGAGPRVEATRIRVTGRQEGARLTVTVADTGVGADAALVASGAGTGLSRLRERLLALFGDRASLGITTTPGAGFAATITLPLDHEEGR
jgi:hypothetical protein